MDNMVNNMPQNDKTADATCVFRVPSSDVTVPDLMANVRITAPVLSIVKGPQTGAAFELEDDVTTIGLGARIEDLGSLNGTWVDGAIVNAAPLHDGSSVQIGTFTLIYHESTPERIETGE